MRADQYLARYRRRLNRKPCPFCDGSGDKEHVQAEIIRLIIEDWLHNRAIELAEGK